jgi:chromosome segregation ATPase
MAIPSVIQGTVETENGKVFELDSPKGSAWLESIDSFRYEPTGANKPYTVRHEASGYWYGCRKIAGKVRKKYIGKTSEVNTAKLEAIAAALELPPVSQVNKVVEVEQRVVEVVEDKQVAENRFTALESEVVNLRKALEALQEELLGQSQSSDSEELPKVDSKVAERLQNELSNLKVENEWLKQKLAENRGTVETLKGENEALRTAQPVAEVELPEPAELLNRLKAKRKKSTASLADIEAILEILEESTPDGGD